MTDVEPSFREKAAQSLHSVGQGEGMNTNVALTNFLYNLVHGLNPGVLVVCLV